MTSRIEKIAAKREAGLCVKLSPDCGNKALSPCEHCAAHLRRAIMSLNGRRLGSEPVRISESQTETARTKVARPFAEPRQTRGGNRRTAPEFQATGRVAAPTVFADERRDPDLLSRAPSAPYS